MVIFVKFRNDEVAVAVTNHGYEPDTSAHDIEWEFVGDDAEPADITDIEDEDISRQVFEIVTSPHFYDEDPRWEL